MISNKLLTRLLVCCVFLGFIFVAGCGDEDCPICPQEELSNYNVLFSGVLSQGMFYYNTKTKTVFDTLFFDDLTYLSDIALSGDGKDIIFSNTDQSGVRSLIVIDAATRDTIKIQPITVNKIEVSNTGKYIAVYNGPDGLQFLDGETYEVLFTDTIAIYSGRFLLDDTRFYFVRGNQEYGIYDMPGESLLTMQQYVDNEGFSPDLFGIQPSADGSLIYFRATYGYYSDYLLPYSPPTDSTLYHYYQIGPLADGDIRLTPDGSQVIVTDPGSVTLEQPGSLDIIFLDAATGAMIARVPGINPIPGPLPYGYYPGKIAITPDSRLAIIAGVYFNEFGVVDCWLHKHVDIFRHDPNLQGSFNMVACQKF